jgi:tRNA (mo5U34)-methyltransferase
VNPATAAELRSAVASNHAWYHTIELPGGVVTPGFVDWRKHAARILPKDLGGMRALDIGTFDGFWAFEMEKRGASVVAIDVDQIDAADWPPVNRERLLAETAERGVDLGRGFRVAHEGLSSTVERVVCNVQALSRDAIGGSVDVAFLGAVLVHLRDPVGALERIRLTLKPGGRLIALEAVSMVQTLLHRRTPMARFDTGRAQFNWWLPNSSALHQYFWAAGFEPATRIGFFRPPSKPEMRGWYCGLSAQAPAQNPTAG